MLPFVAPKYPELSERGIIARLEHVLKEFRAAHYRRLDERMRYLVEQIGMSIDDAQDAVSATSPYLEHINFFELDDAENVKLKAADKAKIARRAKALHDRRKRYLPNLSWLKNESQLEAIYAASRGVDLQGIVTPEESDEIIAGIHAQMPWLRDPKANTLPWIALLSDATGKESSMENNINIVIGFSALGGRYWLPCSGG